MADNDPLPKFEKVILKAGFPSGFTLEEGPIVDLNTPESIDALVEELLPHIAASCRADLPDSSEHEEVHGTEH